MTVGRVGVVAQTTRRSSPHGSRFMTMNHLARWLADDDGQDLVEYVLLGAAVAFAGLLAMNNFDDVINAVYSSYDGATQAIWEPQDPQ